MTRSALLCLACVAAFRLAAAAAESVAFVGTPAASGGVVRLKAAEPYLKWKKAERKAAVETESRAYSGVGAAVVEYPGGGEIWTVEAGSATLADSWSRGGMRFGRRARKAGRWFGHVGGQFVRGGDLPSNGWTGRLGTTLFKDRYDAALAVSRNTFTESDDSAVTTLGLTARALYPYTEHAGFNLGLQLDRVSYTGYSNVSPSAVGGINIYLPGGSFDVSLSFGEAGRLSLLAGYTVYITK